MAQGLTSTPASAVRTLFNTLVTLGGYVVGMPTIGGPAGAIAAHGAKNHLCQSLHLRCEG